MPNLSTSAVPDARDTAENSTLYLMKLKSLVEKTDKLWS